MKKKLILASNSPRRRYLLHEMGYHFEIVPSPYDEKLSSNIFEYAKIENLAKNKAYGILPFIKKETIILSADTVVVLDGKILGKPHSVSEAFSMLESLSNKKHSVVTSVCAINSKTKDEKIISTTSFVEFNKLTPKMIKNYIEKYEPFDKAGSYGIQELPEGFIKNITGSFENIVGLPKEATTQLLQFFEV